MHPIVLNQEPHVRVMQVIIIIVSKFAQLVIIRVLHAITPVLLHVLLVV